MSTSSAAVFPAAAGPTPRVCSTRIPAPPLFFFVLLPRVGSIERERTELLLWGVRKFLDVEFFFFCCCCFIFVDQNLPQPIYNRFCILLRVSQVCGLRNLSSKSRRQQVEKKRVGLCIMSTYVYTQNNQMGISVIT